MVEFKGYINGEAEKCFRRINRRLAMQLVAFAWVMIFPAIMVWAAKGEDWSLVGMCGSSFFLLELATFIPQTKKAQKSYTPHHIIVDETHITCKAEAFAEIRSIKDVKMVIDHGDFYEFVFPFGKVSKNFVCQKDLLLKGTLEDFEELFAGKVVKG